MKKGIGLIFLILLLASVVSLAQSPGTPPGIDPSSAEKMRTFEKEVKENTQQRIADKDMNCAQIQQELTKIMIHMGPEADDVGDAATRAREEIKKSEQKGGVYTAAQAQQRIKQTQPAMTELYSSVADLATADPGSGGMARTGVLMRLSKEKNCAHDTQGIPKEILDESGDK